MIIADDAGDNYVSPANKVIYVSVINRRKINKTEKGEVKVAAPTKKEMKKNFKTYICDKTNASRKTFRAAR